MPTPPVVDFLNHITSPQPSIEEYKQRARLTHSKEAPLVSIAASHPQRSFNSSASHLDSKKHRIQHSENYRKGNTNITSPPRQRLREWMTQLRTGELVSSVVQQPIIKP